MTGLQSSATSARAGSSPRWRDIQFVAFEPVTEPSPEPEPPPPEPVAPTPIAPTPIPPAAVTPPRPAANGNEPLSEPFSARHTVPVRAPEPPFAGATARTQGSAVRPERPAPRYGRAIAPLPPHLIASVPAPPRTSLPPAQVKLRPTTGTLGKTGMPQGVPFSRRRGVRRLRLAVLVTAAVCVAGVAALYKSDLGARPPSRFDGASTNAVAATVAPAAAPVPALPPAPTAPPAPDPAVKAAAVPAAAPDRVGMLTAQAKDGDTGAEYDLGVIYARGDGVAQDYAKAATWFREAAINGNVAAQYNLAVLYERGLGLPQSMNEALIWYHSAAARNYPSAQYNLALSYAEGRGTPQDMVAAARWYHRAAEQGVVAAMVNFAILCEGGQGTDKAPQTAYAWYHAAAARGDEAAAKRADELYRQFSGDDRKAADAAATTAAGSIHEMIIAPAPPGRSAARAPVQTPG